MLTLIHKMRANGPTKAEEPDAPHPTTCASYLSTPIDSVVKSKILEKTTRYVTSGMIVADEFRVGVVFSTGG